MVFLIMTTFSLSNRETLALVDVASTLTRAEALAQGWLGMVPPLEIALSELAGEAHKLDTCPPAFKGWIRTAFEEGQRWRRAMCDGDDTKIGQQATIDALAAARSVLRTWLALGI